MNKSSHNKSLRLQLILRSGMVKPANSQLINISPRRPHDQKSLFWTISWWLKYYLFLIKWRGKNIQVTTSTMLDWINISGENCCSNRQKPPSHLWQRWLPSHLFMPLCHIIRYSRDVVVQPGSTFPSSLLRWGHENCSCKGDKCHVKTELRGQYLRHFSSSVYWLNVTVP